MGLTQAREIVIELLSTIRSEPNPALAEQVKALYAFIYQQLVEGSFEKNTQKIDVAIERLEYERETWVLLMQQLADERAASNPNGADEGPQRAFSA
jgi:flagellin-specific chaperone FliS